MRLSDEDFDRGLDAYQARLYDLAHQADMRSGLVAARPNADRVEVPFSDLRPGDFMTAEGPGGRFVRVVELRGPASSVKTRRQRHTPLDGEIEVLFEIPEAVTVSGERRYWITRRLDEPVVIDMTCRTGICPEEEERV